MSTYHPNIQKAFALLGIPAEAGVKALRHAYVREEQPLFIASDWSYSDERQKHNQVKALLVAPGVVDTLEDPDRMWAQEILWFWYHHAISMAINNDQMDLAREFSAKAVSYQEAQLGGHPNQITPLFFYLLHGYHRYAAELALTIMDEDREVALEILNMPIWQRQMELQGH